MAMTSVTVQVVSAMAGTARTLSAVNASGDYWANNEIEFVEVLNSETSDNVLTIAAQKKCDFGTLHNISIDIGAGSTQIFGKIPTRWFNNGSDQVIMNYATASGLTLGVFRLE
jgi:hypothetical protein